LDSYTGIYYIKVALYIGSQIYNYIKVVLMMLYNTQFHIILNSTLYTCLFTCAKLYNRTRE